MICFINRSFSFWYQCMSFLTISFKTPFVVLDIDKMFVCASLISVSFLSFLSSWSLFISSLKQFCSLITAGHYSPWKSPKQVTYIGLWNLNISAFDSLYRVIESCCNIITMCLLTLGVFLFFALTLFVHFTLVSPSRYCLKLLKRVKYIFHHITRLLILRVKPDSWLYSLLLSLSLSYTEELNCCHSSAL